jgi:hypothetical protein
VVDHAAAGRRLTCADDARERAAAGAFLLDTGLRYVLAVAQAGSIAEASAELHAAASAISRQIARLEHQIGVPLMLIAVLSLAALTTIRRRLALR